MSKTIDQLNSFTNDFITRCFEHPVGMETELPLEDRQKMASLFGAVLDTIVEKSGGKSKWEPSCHFECQGKPMAMVEAEMKKTGARCRLHLHAGSVYLLFSLPHRQEIPSMDNQFWKLLTASVVDHNLKYEPYQDFEAIGKNPENKKLSRFTKSAAFSLLAEFIIGYQHDPDFQKLGKFEKSAFFQETDWQTIIDQFSPVVADFTKLSQALYRSFYIKTSKTGRLGKPRMPGDLAR
ncbi:MAG: hypothetical protein EAZ82_07695 [Verrucomicrobia bacterium]|nr:MAG: hypothetical protein EAZ82_07695 [Verrucomicrobiota bacterium]